MKDYERIFDWVEFDEGRARFAGAIRGYDERRHETFALEIDGRIYYGEIKNIFLPNGQDFNLEIGSFGYYSDGDVGIPLSDKNHLAARFSIEQLDVAKHLICKLIDYKLGTEDKPSVLDETPDSRFMGKVFFREGWALAESLGVIE